MTTRTLTEVGAYLEETTMALSGDSTSPAELYETYEMTAIQILDSEFDLHPEGDLEEFLMDFLKAKRQQLGL